MRTHVGVNNSVPCPPLGNSTPKTLPRQPLSPAGPRPVLKLTLFRLQPHQLPQHTTHSVLPTFLQPKQVQHGCPRCVLFAPSAIQQGFRPAPPAPLRKIYGHQAMPQPAYSWNKQAMRPSPPTRPSPPLILLTLILITTQVLRHKLLMRPSPPMSTTTLLQTIRSSQTLPLRNYHNNRSHANDDTIEDLPVTPPRPGHNLPRSNPSRGPGDQQKHGYPSRGPIDPGDPERKTTQRMLRRTEVCLDSSIAGVMLTLDPCSFPLMCMYRPLS